MQALASEFENASTNLDDAFLERLLSAMAELPDASDSTQVWDRLSTAGNHHSNKVEGSHDNDKDWNTGWSTLSKVVGELIPTELHATSLSCSVFGETATFAATCLALSCRALHGCPNPLTRLRKRWKSMVMETLQLQFWR